MIIVDSPPEPWSAIVTLSGIIDSAITGSNVICIVSFVSRMKSSIMLMVAQNSSNDVSDRVPLVCPPRL